MLPCNHQMIPNVRMKLSVWCRNSLSRHNHSSRSPVTIFRQWRLLPRFQTAEREAVVPKKSSPFRFGTVSIVSLLVILLLVGGSIFYFSTTRGSGQLSASVNNHPTAVVTHPASTQRPTPTLNTCRNANSNTEKRYVYSWHL